MPGLIRIDINEATEERAKFMGLDIIGKPELKNVSAHLLKQVFLILV